MFVRQWLVRYWFLTGMMLLALITAADTREWTVAAGRALKNHGGPGLVIFSIFLLSGLTLDTGLLRKGLGDWRASGAAMLVIFIVSPLAALALGCLPLNVQILTGLYLVAVMPSTLSTGVVMTQSAGGNMAHALFVTILANTLAVFSIPLVLSVLLAAAGGARGIQIDKAAIMLQIAWLVVSPLALGVGLRHTVVKRTASLVRQAQFINQVLVLFIIWMGMSQSRSALVAGGHALAAVSALTITFHLLLVLAALGLCRLFAIGPGRRESVVFMGGQKTLPLSVILQVNLFPEYGLALALCVVHHILHLIIDAYLVERLRK